MLLKRSFLGLALGVKFLFSYSQAFADSLENESLKENCRQKIRSALLKGITSEDSLLIHGTNFYSIRSGLENNDGHLLTGRSPGNEQRIYFFPNTHHPEAARFIPPDHRFEGNIVENVSAQEAIEGVRWYANRGAQEALFHQLFFEKFGNSLPHSKITELMENLDDFNHFDVPINRRSFSRNTLRELNNWISLIRNESGIALSFSTDLLNEFDIRRADGDDDGIYIEVPKGLPLHYINGILPFNARDYQRINELIR